MRFVLSSPMASTLKSSLPNRNILIVGAEIAGPILAYFLHHFDDTSFIHYLGTMV